MKSQTASTNFRLIFLAALLAATVLGLAGCGTTSGAHQGAYTSVAGGAAL